MEKITQNFYWHEMLGSYTAERLGIDNTPPKKVHQQIQVLVQRLLQPLRDELGKVITVSSGYRCPQLNLAIGGVKNSQHLLGQAADIQCHSAKSTHDLFLFILNTGLSYDQCILEKVSETNPYAGWVHVSFNEDNNRMEFFEITKSGKNKVYVRKNES